MTKIDRRRLLSGAAAGLSLLTISAARAAEPKEVALWPGLPPGGEAVKVEQVVQESTNPMGRVSRVYSHVIKPTLTLYAPASGQATDAILVIPGGGFNSVWVEKEGHEIARWLAENGIAAGVLLYRLPTEPWASGTDVVLQDAQRGMRILRAQSGPSVLASSAFRRAEPSPPRSTPDGRTPSTQRSMRSTRPRPSPISAATATASSTSPKSPHPSRSGDSPRRPPRRSFSTPPTTRT